MKTDPRNLLVNFYQTIRKVWYIQVTRYNDGSLGYTLGGALILVILGKSFCISGFIYELVLNIEYKVVR